MIDLDRLQTFNTSVTHAFHGKIFECDMREASIQIARVFNLLPIEKINYLKALPKEERVVQTGLCQKNDPLFSETLQQKLKEVRRHFIEENNIKDEEILSIHSDAIMLNTKRKIKYTVDNIEFRPKHKWTSYIRYQNIEMFYDEDTDHIDYKGINSELLGKHTFGLQPHILKVFQMIENNDERIFRYLSKYQCDYLTRKLKPECYIPFEKINGDEFLTNLNLLSYLCKIAIKEC